MLEAIRRRFGRVNSQERLYSELLKLAKVWNKQVDKFIELDFNATLSMSPEDYKNSFLKFSPVPLEHKYQGRLDIPLLIDPRVPLDQQLKMAGIDDTPNNIQSVIDFKPSPKKPYNIWTHNPIRFLPTKVNNLTDVPGIIPEDEDFLNIGEIVSLFIHHPEFFRLNKVDTLGSGIKMNNGSLIIPGISSSPFPRLRLNYPNEKITVQTRGKQISIAL